MARKTPSRLELRRQHEALDAQQPAGEAAPKTSKAKKGEKAPKAEKAKKPSTRAKKSKEKALVRKKLVWVVYSPGMKEEGRFAYDKREDAEKRLETLKLKHNKPYFIQPVKEVLEGGQVAVMDAPSDDDPPVRKPRARPRDEDADDEVERDDDDDD